MTEQGGDRRAGTPDPYPAGPETPAAEDPGAAGLDGGDAVDDRTRASAGLGDAVDDRTRASAGLGDAAQPGAGEVTATVIVHAPAPRVFKAFTAWERQGEWIPFTRVRVVDGDGGQGSSIEAITQVGPAVLRDEMRVVKLDPPYEIRVVHYGRMLRGPGVVRCTPMGGSRTQVVWHEWFHLPGGSVGRLTWPVLWPGSKYGLTQALRRFARLVEQGVLP